MSIFVRQPQYIKYAYSCAESFSHWEHFLKTTASLSNSIPPCFYNPANFIGVLTPMAGVGLFRVGLKVLIPTRCHARNQASRRILFRSIYICYERSSSWILSLVAPRTPPLSTLSSFSRGVYFYIACDIGYDIALAAADSHSYYPCHRMTIHTSAPSEPGHLR